MYIHPLWIAPLSPDNLTAFAKDSSGVHQVWIIWNVYYADVNTRLYKIREVRDLRYWMTYPFNFQLWIHADFYLSTQKLLNVINNTVNR